MTRAIVRYSFSSEGKTTRNQVRNVLREAGFAEIGTASYEARTTSHSELMPALTALLRIVEAPPDGKLDHVWIYLDDSPPSS